MRVNADRASHASKDARARFPLFTAATAAKDMPPIGLGDCVRFLAGGRPMLVYSIDADRRRGVCVWVSEWVRPGEGRLHYDTINLDLVMRLGDDVRGQRDFLLGVIARQPKTAAEAIERALGRVCEELAADDAVAFLEGARNDIDAKLDELRAAGEAGR